MGMDGASYENPVTMSYNFGEVDFGAGDEATAISRPQKARYARIREIQVSATEGFTQDSTQGFVRIGTAGDNDKFAELGLSNTSDTDAIGTYDDNSAIKDAGKLIDMENDGDSSATLSQLELNLVAPTGGTPAGKGFVAIVIEWW